MGTRAARGERHGGVDVHEWNDRHHLVATMDQLESLNPDICVYGNGRMLLRAWRDRLVGKRFSRASPHAGLEGADDLFPR